MKISRRVIADDGTAKKEEKVLTINVKPGWKSGTKITFQREGDQVTDTSQKLISDNETNFSGSKQNSCRHSVYNT